jgi:hypothetical protein
MGRVSHHVVVVTTSLENLHNLVHAKAVEAGLIVTPIVKTPERYLYSFMIVPDGHPEGWEGSNAGDDSRSAFISWCRVYNGTSDGPIH